MQRGIRGGLLAGVIIASAGTAGAQPLDPATADRFMQLALDCIHREYPNKIAHVLTGDDDVRPPRELTPAFYGCYDWHSAVHGHWLLVRLARLADGATLAPAARDALAQNLTRDNITAELRYLRGSGRTSFERPYGLAWLLQLAAELREWRGDRQAAGWLAALEPLERETAQRIKDWLPKLTHPIRVGEHSQTAFAFGLMLDWARAADDLEMEQLLRSRTEDYYGNDRACPLAYEPSGQDFLSPCLAEADLIRRVRGPDEFAAWLDGFLPGIPRGRQGARQNGLAGTGRRDRPERRQAGAPRRPEPQPRLDAGRESRRDCRPATRGCPHCAQTARRHREAGLAAVTGEHYAGGHWLASFATYLGTGTRPALRRGARGFRYGSANASTSLLATIAMYCLPFTA